MKRVTAFAPATVANVNVGFDILGFALEKVGDTVTLTALPEPGKIIIDNIEGINSSIPLDPEKNTASVALKSMLLQEKLPLGFRLSIKKGIPLSSGMGGSAASAVAAVVAANAFLPTPLPKNKLLSYALDGESLSSGSRHADNVAPCLYGGLTAVLGEQEILSLPIPQGLYTLVIHPHYEVNTKESRAILAQTLSLKDHVLQSSYLTGFMTGLFKNDLALMSRSFKDIIIGPQRASLIPLLPQAQAKAQELGALGIGIAGSGPSLFVWASSLKEAKKIEQALLEIYQKAQLPADSWIGPINQEGAKILDQTT